MSSDVKKKVLAAVVAVALAAAVSYGLISQQTADKVQTQADQALQRNGTGTQQSVPQPTSPQSPTAQPIAPTQQGTAPTPAAPRQ